MLQVLEEVRGFGGRIDEVGLRLDRMERRMSDQADALMLVAANVHRLTPVVKQRLDDHEERIGALEKARAG